MGRDMDNDREMMGLAFDEAGKADSRVGTNPYVGCVIAKDGVAVSTGYHSVFGGGHAEINAIFNLLSNKGNGEVIPRGLLGGDWKGALKGYDVYVTLEPCSHEGKTQSCAETLANLRPDRVVIGALDINPIVCGRGLLILKDAGVKVVDLSVEFAERANYLNRAFNKYITTGAPWVTHKIAISADGYISAQRIEAMTITGMDSKRDVHIIRSKNGAIVTGAGTLLADNPKLNIRLIEGDFKNPDAYVLTTRKLNTNNFNIAKASRRTVECINYNDYKWEEIFTYIAKKSNTHSVMVEAGAKVNTSLLDSGLADELVLYKSEKRLGKGYPAYLALGKYMSLEEVLINYVMYRTENIGDDEKKIYLRKELE
ncbi:MAG: bifunctional diaminohydroxyphosphoribosylaminopyrimidine deaminase/5-amino-6-(5-phosphoribosylamino)uracil reductase RibD [Candidatus Kapaibacteriales bacterium]